MEEQKKELNLVEILKEPKPYKKEFINKTVFDSNAQCCDIMNHLIKEETDTKHLLGTSDEAHECYRQ